MEKIYNDILFDESGQSIPLLADDLIDYLIDQLNAFRIERDSLEKKLAEIQSILNSKNDTDNY